MAEPTHAVSSTREPKLLDRVRASARVRHLSLRTERTYVQWIRRYIVFHGKRHPAEMGEAEINAFLTHLAVEGKVSASTQTQALCAILFLYRAVLGRDVGELEGLIRARRRRKLPVVLSREEVKSVLSHLQGTEYLFLALLYGTGMRLMEALRLRVKDIDFSSSQILIRDGKGAKDRVTMLPLSLKPLLVEHLKMVRKVHGEDLRRGHGRVYLPYALERKYPQADVEWGWQWVFPAPEFLGGSPVWRPPSASPPRQGNPKGFSECCAEGRSRQTRDLPHPPPLVRHALTHGGVRHPDGAGAVGSPEPADDDDLHTCPEPGREGSAESGRLTLTPYPTPARGYMHTLPRCRSRSPRSSDAGTYPPPDRFEGRGLIAGHRSHMHFRMPPYPGRLTSLTWTGW